MQNTGSARKSRRMKWMEQVAHIDMTYRATVSVGKPKGKRSLGRYKRKKKNNIHVDFN
jgi:hypothetical protein